MDLGGVTPPIIRERLTYGRVVCFIVCYPITRLIINMNSLVYFWLIWTSPLVRYYSTKTCP